ncbi:MAG: hypothetical protein P4L76_12645 [Beijerinckiaceae bacterium]|nr:hypothetical protein [Beijerinckiaceae bacterium]
MSLSFDERHFVALYPSGVEAKNGTAIEFKSQDANYRVYIPGRPGSPSIIEQSSGGLTIALQQDHIIGLATDDHSTTKLTFKQDGSPSQIDISGGIDHGTPYEIPGVVTTVLDLTVEALGAIGALESAGISEAVAQEVVADITAAAEAFNVLSNFIFRFADDGGTLNFPAVIAHNINKTCTSVVTNPPRPPATTSVTIDANVFGDAMNNQSDFEVEDYNSSNHGWAFKGGQAMEYKHARRLATDWHYRTWRPDMSELENGAGVLVSCKIDQDRTGADDHTVILTAFDVRRNYIGAQVEIQSGPIVTDHVHARGKTPWIWRSSYSDDAKFVAAVQDAVAAVIKEIEDGKEDEGFEYMATITKDNLVCLKTAVVSR